MRGSWFLLSAALLAYGGQLSAQHAIGVTAEITGVLSAPAAQIEVVAGTATQVHVREVRGERTGTQVLERSWIESSGDAASSEQESALGSAAGAAAGSAAQGGVRVELKGNGVEVKLGGGRVVRVTRVVASNS